MVISYRFFLPLLFCSFFIFVEVVNAIGTVNGSEQWGYVEVRPGAHMFWWLYRSPQRVDNASTPWPTVLWLQGGPGASGIGLGNFQEIGPLDINLRPRESTWLRKVDLLFVDNPVGTGFSFVTNLSLLVKTDWEAAADLTTLLKKLSIKYKSLQKSPLFIVGESYGGKFVVTAALSIVNAIKSGELKLKLGGNAFFFHYRPAVCHYKRKLQIEHVCRCCIRGFLDFTRRLCSFDLYVVFSWGPLLLDVSRIDINGEKKSNILAQEIKEKIEKDRYGDARLLWIQLEDIILSSSNDVDFYNFLLDSDMDPVFQEVVDASNKLTMRTYPTYLSSKVSTSFDLSSFMNGVIKKKLKIIPKDVSWGEQSDQVFDSLSNDFMKPRIKEVDELLSLGINVTIYNGQVDLICATKGTEAWVQKLQWKGLKGFINNHRSPLYCSTEDEGTTKGFFKSYQNLQFYWILKAGHFVPVDQPCVSLQMIANITQSPAAASS